MLSLPSLDSPCHLFGRESRRLGLIRLPIYVAKAPVCDKTVPSADQEVFGEAEAVDLPPGRTGCSVRNASRGLPNVSVGGRWSVCRGCGGRVLEQHQFCVLLNLGTIQLVCADDWTCRVLTHKDHSDVVDNVADSNKDGACDLLVCIEDVSEVHAPACRPRKSAVGKERPRTGSATCGVGTVAFRRGLQDRQVQRTRLELSELRLCALAGRAPVVNRVPVLDQPAAYEYSRDQRYQQEHRHQRQRRPDPKQHLFSPSSSGAFIENRLHNAL